MMYPSIDPHASRSWVFPTNLSVRKYQVDICRTALENNTLVCLPTGLGKTLIAAVLVFNFYRFYPEGKIVFMAPTKPLVSQQFKACTQIMHLPDKDVVLLEGSTNPSKREMKWKEARVFFITPQTLANDLESGVVSPATARKFVLVVADEAHRATNGYAYTHIVQHFTKCNNNFRVLALSATPGSDMRSVQNVIYNLNIARIEIRSEEDAEVAQYTHLKQIEIIKCSNCVTKINKLRNSNYFNDDDDDDDGADLFNCADTGKGKGNAKKSICSPSQEAAINKHLSGLMGPAVSYLSSQNILLNDNAEYITPFILQDAERNCAQKLRDMSGEHRIANVNHGYGQQHQERSEDQLLRARLHDAIAVLTFLTNCKKTYCGTSGIDGHGSGAPALRIMLEDKQVEIQSILSAGSGSGSDVGGQDNVSAVERVRFFQSMVTSNQFKGLLSLLRSIRNVAGGTVTTKNSFKIQKLRQILAEHFQRHQAGGSSSRAIVFGELRSTVYEIVSQLSDIDGLKPHEFVGQSGSSATSSNAFSTHATNNNSSGYMQATGAGVSQLKDIQLNRLHAGGGSGGLNQQEQAQVISLFHSGEINVLVATCIAEEGLDIGEVDLIVLFDSVASPTRLVQRMGRTGRKRAGRVVMLTSDGDSKDEAKIERCSLASEQIMAALYNPANKLRMYKNDKRLLPAGNQCELVYRSITDSAGPSPVASGIAAALNAYTKHSSSANSGVLISGSASRNYSSAQSVSSFSDSGSSNKGSNAFTGSSFNLNSGSFQAPSSALGHVEVSVVARKHRDIVCLLDDSDGEDQGVRRGSSSNNAEAIGSAGLGNTNQRFSSQAVTAAPASAPGFDGDDVWGFGTDISNTSNGSGRSDRATGSGGSSKDKTAGTKSIVNYFGTTKLNVHAGGSSPVAAVASFSMSGARTSVASVSVSPSVSNKSPVGLADTTNHHVQTSPALRLCQLCSVELSPLASSASMCVDCIRVVNSSIDDAPETEIVAVSTVRSDTSSRSKPSPLQPPCRQTCTVEPTVSLLEFTDLAPGRIGGDDGNSGGEDYIVDTEFSSHQNNNCDFNGNVAASAVSTIPAEDRRNMLAGQFESAAEAGRRVVRQEVACSDYDRLFVVGRVSREDAAAASIKSAVAVAVAVAVGAPVLVPIKPEPLPNLHSPSTSSALSSPSAVLVPVFPSGSASGLVSASTSGEFTVDLSDGDEEEEEEEEEDDDDDEEIVFRKSFSSTLLQVPPAVPVPPPTEAVLAVARPADSSPTSEKFAVPMRTAATSALTETSPAGDIWGFQLGDHIQMSPSSPYSHSKPPQTNSQSAVNICMDFDRESDALQAALPIVPEVVSSVRSVSSIAAAATPAAVPSEQIQTIKPSGMASSRVSMGPVPMLENGSSMKAVAAGMNSLMTINGKPKPAFSLHVPSGGGAQEWTTQYADANVSIEGCTGIDDPDDFYDDKGGCYFEHGYARSPLLLPVSMSGRVQASSYSKLISSAKKVAPRSASIDRVSSPCANETATRTKRRLIPDTPESQRASQDVRATAKTAQGSRVLPVNTTKDRKPLTAITIDDSTDSDGGNGIRRSPVDVQSFHDSSAPASKVADRNRNQQLAVAETSGSNAGSDMDSDDNDDNGADDDDVACAVCGEKDTEHSGDCGMAVRTMMFCDGECGAAVHVGCYFGTNTLRSAKKLRHLKMHDFYCDGCEYIRNSSNNSSPRTPCCTLCHCPGGMLKQNTDGSFVHLICVLYTPELFLDPATQQLVDRHKLVPARRDLLCVICRGKGGACVQCAFKNCTVAMHPYCANQNDRQMVIRYESLSDSHSHSQVHSQHHQQLQRPLMDLDAEDEDEDENEDRGFVYEIYCKRHCRHVNGRLRDILYSSLPASKEHGSADTAGLIEVKSAESEGTENLLNYSDDYGLLENTQCALKMATSDRYDKGGKMSRLKKVKGAPNTGAKTVSATDVSAKESAKAKQTRLRKKQTREKFRQLAARNSRKLVTDVEAGLGRHFVDDEAECDYGDGSDFSDSNSDGGYADGYGGRRKGSKARRKKREKEREKLKAARLLAADDEDDDGEDFDGYEASFINDGEYTQFVPDSVVKSMRNNKSKSRHSTSSSDSSINNSVNSDSSDLLDSSALSGGERKKLRYEKVSRKRGYEDEQAMYLCVNRDLDQTPGKNKHGLGPIKIGPRFALNLATYVNTNANTLTNATVHGHHNEGNNSNDHGNSDDDEYDSSFINDGEYTQYISDGEEEL